MTIANKVTTYSCLYQLLLIVVGLSSIDGGKDLPAFLTSPHQFKAKLGEDLHLPCKTSLTGSAVITWSWNGRLVSAGSMKVYADDRIEVVDDGRELLVREIKRGDRGKYTCTVNLKLQPVSLSHQVEILVKPTVSISSMDKIVNVEEGSTTQYECSAHGFPKPKVHWILKSNPEKVLSKVSTLILRQVEPDNAGQYLCIATNSEGRSEDGLKINVFYKPRTKLVLKTSSRHSYSTTAVLSCQVEGNPSAKVLWYKDNLDIGKPIIKIRKEGKFEHHSLTIPSMGESDYGNYSCLAKNNLGTASDSVLLTGSPDQPMIVSSTQGISTNTYKLEWKVWSPQQFPVLNQSILYRRIRKGVTSASRLEEPGSWNNLALISDGRSQHSSTYSMVLTGLDKSAEYEVRLRTMNRQGWSGLSNSFTFTTASFTIQADNYSSLSGRQLTSSSRISTISTASVLAAIFANAVISKSR